MRIALGVPFSDTTVIVRNLATDVYIAIGKEAEIILYTSHTQSKQAQIRQLKKFAERLWDELNDIDEEPEEWGVTTPNEVLIAALNQDAYDEELPWEVK